MEDFQHLVVIDQPPLLPAEGTAQQGTNSQGRFCAVLVTSSWQVIQKPEREDDLLTNMEELSRDVKAGSVPGCSDHEMVAFMILGGENEAKSRITALDFRRAEFGLLRTCLDESHAIQP